MSVKLGTTAMLIVELPIQPCVLVASTVYIVVMAGVTDINDPLTGPGNQVYVAAPPAVNVAEEPAQIDGEDAVAFIVGVGLTRTDTVCVVRQPKAEAPVTVYVFPGVGVAVMLELTMLPGFQV
jgi:uncharacterized NAD(P)/FAD-binding protein YdhS